MPEQHRQAAQNIRGLIHLTDWMPRDHTWQLKRPRNARGSGGSSHGCRTSQPTLCGWSALISIRRVAGESKSASGRGGRSRGIGVREKDSWSTLLWYPQETDPGHSNPQRFPAPFLVMLKKLGVFNWPQNFFIFFYFALVQQFLPTVSCHYHDSG